MPSKYINCGHLWNCMCAPHIEKYGGNYVATVLALQKQSLCDGCGGAGI